MSRKVLGEVESMQRLGRCLEMRPCGKMEVRSDEMRAGQGEKKSKESARVSPHPMARCTMQGSIGKCERMTEKEARRAMEGRWTQVSRTGVEGHLHNRHPR